MMYRVTCLLLSLMMVTSPAAAAKKDRAVPMKPDIAAVVGGEVISTYDVDNRVSFIIVSGKLPPTQEVKDKVRPQILRSLIDEKLQLAEAKANGINVGNDGVQKAIIGIEKDRGLPPGSVLGMLESHHLPKETFTEQIRAQLAWRELVLKRLRPQIRINDEEIKLARLSPSASDTPQELKIAVLTLPVDKPAREQEVKATAAKLAKEVRDGASFEEVTRQLGGGSSRNADDAFWVRPEQLDPILARALITATTGTITEPVRSSTGYTIIKVHDIRSRTASPAKNSEVAYKEILLELSVNAPREEADTLLMIAEEVARHPGTCEEKGVAGIDGLNDVNIEVSHHRDTINSLPQGVKTIISGLKIGDISTPFASETGIRLYMLCERKESDASEEEIAQLRNQIYQQKLELEAQKYLRNLRRNTFIDIRS